MEERCYTVQTEPDLRIALMYNWGFPTGSVVRYLPVKQETGGLICRSGRSPGGGNYNLLRFSCLKSPTGRGT